MSDWYGGGNGEGDWYGGGGEMVGMVEAERLAHGGGMVGLDGSPRLFSMVCQSRLWSSLHGLPGYVVGVRAE